MMLPSLPELAARLGGRVRRDKTGPHVVAPGPGCKRSDRSLSIWNVGDDLRVHSHRGLDWREGQAYVRRRAGLPEWTPKGPTSKARPVPKPDRRLAAQRVREVMRCLDRRPSLEHFALLINEARNAGATRDELVAYGRAFGFTTSDVEAITKTPARRYSADAAAKILGLTYDRRQALKIRTLGQSTWTRPAESAPVAIGTTPSAERSATAARSWSLYRRLTPQGAPLRDEIAS